MSRVGIDTRWPQLVHQGLVGFLADVEARIVAACEAAGYEVVRGTVPITSNEVAVSEAQEARFRRPDLTVFNYPVWAFPHFSVHAAHATTGPLMLFSNIDPAYPGMVSMLAAGGSLDQLGRRHERLWGDIINRRCGPALARSSRPPTPCARLEGSTFARIGGRSMGMYTAVGPHR